jgi:hypothetical protein
LEFGNGLFAFFSFLTISLVKVVEMRGKIRVAPAWLQPTGFAHVAQSVEHILGKDEVTGSTPVMGLLGWQGNDRGRKKNLRGT